MTNRRFLSLLALVNGLVALYLHLWKIGKAGEMACGGSFDCARIQTSVYSWFMGVDVALIGTWGYTAIFLVATIGSIGRLAESRWPTWVLMALIYGAFLFTLRLKYYEFFVLKGFCPWCAISAVSITVATVVITVAAIRERGREDEKTR